MRTRLYRAGRRPPSNTFAWFLLVRILPKGQEKHTHFATDKLAARLWNKFGGGPRKLVASTCQAQRQTRPFSPEEQLDTLVWLCYSCLFFWNKDNIHLSKRANGEIEQQMGNGSEYIPAEALYYYFEDSGGCESFFLISISARLAPANK